MSKVNLVAESIQDWEKFQNEEKINEELQKLNEGAKSKLEAFIKNPEKKDKFSSAFARQLGKTKGLKNAISKLSDENLLKLAKQALNVMEKNPKLGYPWIKISGGKIVGAGALPVKSSSLGKELGA